MNKVKLPLIRRAIMNEDPLEIVGRIAVNDYPYSQIPSTPNMRCPNPFQGADRKRVTESMKLTALQSPESFALASKGITLVVSRVHLDINPANTFIELGEKDGAADGSNTAKFFESFRSQVDPNLLLPIKIVVSPSDELKRLIVIGLNTGVSQTKSDMLNYDGGYEGLKAALPPHMRKLFNFMSNEHEDDDQTLQAIDLLRYLELFTNTPRSAFDKIKLVEKLGSEPGRLEQLYPYIEDIAKIVDRVYSTFEDLCIYRDQRKIQLPRSIKKSRKGYMDPFGHCYSYGFNRGAPFSYVIPFIAAFKQYLTVDGWKYGTVEETWRVLDARNRFMSYINWFENHSIQQNPNTKAGGPNVVAQQTSTWEKAKMILNGNLNPGYN